MKLWNLNPPTGRVLIGPMTPRNRATPIPPPPVDYFYRFTAGVFEITPPGGAVFVFNFETNDPAPLLSDFDNTFSNPGQHPTALVHISGNNWQLTVSCNGTPFVDNFYRRQVYQNSTGPFGASASSNFIKWEGLAINTPGYPPNNNPIDWPGA